MGKPTGFKEYNRETPQGRSVEERVQDWKEVYDINSFSGDALVRQGARCMDCGIPFCMSGCPLGNIIPEFNDRIYRQRPREALDILLKTNNFPEFTGRVCPAPCEAACVLGINETPVSIKVIEQSIIERGFAEGWIQPVLPQRKTAKRVAIIGSGPAGLAAAMQLNHAGHTVTVFERADRIGGLLVYGIPEFKLEKSIVERRVKLMEAEGVCFQTRTNVGVDISPQELKRRFDVVLLSGGSTKARDLEIPGRELKGVHFAMDYLTQQNKVNLGDDVPDKISATGKNVVVLGGGDTGADCVGTAIRQQALSVKQFEIMPRPPLERDHTMPWPTWPLIMRTSTSHEEGGERDWSIATKSFAGENGQLKRINAVRVEWSKDDKGRFSMREVPGSEFEVDCDLCLLAMGFLHPEHSSLLNDLGVELDPRGNVRTNSSYATNVPGIFAAGDMRRGQSLVVWAIAEGRKAARAIDVFLMGRSDLP